MPSTIRSVGSLRYNTSQAGSPIAICYGTQRVSINLIEFWGFTGSGGGKGGKGLGGAGGKKGSNQQYAVDVALGICQGPVSFTGSTLRHRPATTASGRMAGSPPGSAMSGSTAMPAMTARRPTRSSPAPTRTRR